METLEQLKDIVKNAPEGATHVNTIMPKELDIINYINTNNFTWWHGSTDEWRSFGGMIDITFRSLSDIKRIIELMEG